MISKLFQKKYMIPTFQSNILNINIIKTFSAPKTSDLF